MVTRQRAKAAVYKEESSSLYAPEPVTYEFGGVLGAFIMYFVTLLGALFIILACTKANWSLSKVSNVY